MASTAMPAVFPFTIADSSPAADGIAVSPTLAANELMAARRRRGEAGAAAGVRRGGPARSPVASAGAGGARDRRPARGGPGGGRRPGAALGGGVADPDRGGTRRAHRLTAVTRRACGRPVREISELTRTRTPPGRGIRSARRAAAVPGAWAARYRPTNARSGPALDPPASRTPPPTGCPAGARSPRPGRDAMHCGRSVPCSASRSANRSAQPRKPPPGSRSFSPSVKLSPIATNVPILSAAADPPISSYDASSGSMPGQTGQPSGAVVMAWPGRHWRLG